MTIEWQPIETAPKDGATVLVFGEDHVTPASWDTSKGGWTPWSDQLHIAFKPTHWMPLPEPPKS